MANKMGADLLTNVLIFGGLGLGVWYGYTNNILGIRQAIESMGGKLQPQEEHHSLQQVLSPTYQVLKQDTDLAVDQSPEELQALITRTQCMIHHSEHQVLTQQQE